ncbi:MAG TPA: hypothetical protein VNZ45_18745 [Bacteroidia bacterium]|jgi:hypothetical protein|nr:hypothetical protein [Bacteroidia bacterium]
MKPLHTRMLWLTAFSIAMGFMEAAIVVYLRKIYYPHGFQFPLTPVDPDIGLIEFLREAATIIMLVGIGIIAGKNTSQKFAIFLYCFAIWDIFYYVFLKLILGWPESLFTWDILFIIPVPWVGPVIAPCIVSLTMILLTVSVINIQEWGYDVHLQLREWVLLIAGSLVVIFSFILDYIKYISQGTSTHIWTLSSKQAMFDEISHYVPSSYNWWLFALGEIIILAGIFSFLTKAYKLKAGR